MNLHNFIYGVYPYIALTVFFLGSWVRFDRNQYSWKSDSSQLLSNSNMRIANNLFHIGVIAIFFGHLIGLLTPQAVFESIGISAISHQYVAIAAGSIFGSLCLVGGVILLLRRLFNRRVYAAGKGMDIFILAWLIITLLLGLSTIPVSISHASHGDPAVMLSLSTWVQSILTLRPNPAVLQNVEINFKVHLFFGMTVFLLFPFTRLVHILSVPLGYLARPYQLVRTKTGH